MKTLIINAFSSLCDAIDGIYATPNPQVESFFRDLRVDPQPSSMPLEVERERGEVSEELLFAYTPTNTAVQVPDRSSARIPVMKNA
jgi:hypothetical protein